MCTISGRPASPAVASARSSSASPPAGSSPTTSVDMRIFSPRTTSGLALAVATASSGTSVSGLSSSPKRKSMRPSTETLRKQSTRVREGSTTSRRKAGNVEAPAEPASATATTPRRRCASSTGSAHLGDVVEDVRVGVQQPGDHGGPAAVEGPGAAGGQPRPHGEDPAAAHGHVGLLVAPARRVHHRPARQHHVHDLVHCSPISPALSRRPPATVPTPVCRARQPPRCAAPAGPPPPPRPRPPAPGRTWSRRPSRQACR